MKVELTIDSSNIGETLVDLFKNLPQEKKEEIASQVLEKWLTQPYDIERKAAGQKIIRELRERGDSTWKDNSDEYRKKKDEEIYGSYEFSQRMRNFKSSKEEMILSITQSSIEHYKKITQEKIQNDEQLKKIMEIAFEEIKKDFPKYVHDAICSFFINNMFVIQSGMQEGLQKSNKSLEMNKAIAEHLGMNLGQNNY